METRTHTKKILALLVLILLGMSACGFKSTTTVASVANSIPRGVSTTPEPGNDGKPAPAPDGHWLTLAAARGIIYIGADNGIFYALNASTGSVRWQRALAAPVSFTTVAAAGEVIAATSNTIYALDTSTGAIRWQRKIDHDIAAGNAIIVGQDAIYVASTLIHNVAQGNDSYYVYALQAGNGTQLWRTTVDSSTPGLLGAAAGIVYVAQVTGPAQASGQVSALQASNGRVLWKLSVDSPHAWIRVAFTEANGVTYLANDAGTVYAVRTASGAVLWQHAVAHSNQFGPTIGTSAPVLVNGVLYVNSQTGIMALRATDGQVLWQKKSTFPAPALVVTQPLVSNGVIYVMMSRGVIYALRAQDGVQLWQAANTIPTLGPLTLSDGLISTDGVGEVYALHASDGSLAWQQLLDHHTTESSQQTGEISVDGVMYASKTSGVVQAIRRSDGKLLWSYVIQEKAEPVNPVYGASVVFAPSVSYQQALQIITNLGLQTSLLCQSVWVPEGGTNGFESSHMFHVTAALNSAPLWLQRLATTPGVQAATGMGAVFSCPMMRPGINPIPFLLPQQVNTSVQVTFASSTQSYAEALALIDNLGLRLADPCYEQARAQGLKPTWHAQGQSEAFARSHTLVLATTSVSSLNWLKQLHSAAGVLKVDVSSKITCQ